MLRDNVSHIEIYGNHVIPFFHILRCLHHARPTSFQSGQISFLPFSKDNSLSKIHFQRALGEDTERLSQSHGNLFPLDMFG